MSGVFKHINQPNRKKLRPIALACAFLMLAGSGVLNAQTRSYRAGRWEGDIPQVDGLMSEQGWESAKWEGSFIQRNPYEGEDPTEKTSFKILYDDENLYVAIRANDSEPQNIERRMSRRDDVEGDLVGIEIDSYFDKRTAFTFTVNAAGVKKDATITDDVHPDDSWNPVWYVDVSTDSMGWVAEMKIPLSQLRFARKDEYTWGLQVYRIIHRNSEYSAWQHIPVESPGWVSHYGLLEGISNIFPKKEIEIIPYMMGKTESYKREDSNPFATGRDYGYSFGLDGKVAVTNDLTLNVTVNPDFGQVEADPSEVNLTALESYFREKRPFFVEGSNIYNFGLTGGNGGLSQDNLFYSRRIGRAPQHCPDDDNGEYIDCPESTRILGAAKLSGKTRNGWSIGILESVTNKEMAELDLEGYRRKEAVEPLTNYFNARAQKDFNKGETILGGMFTATNRFINDSALSSLHRAAYTGGVDFRKYWKDRTYYVDFKGVFSHVIGNEGSMIELQESPRRYFQRADADHLSVDSTRNSLTGHGGTLEFGKIGEGHWRYMAWITWRSPGLELNDMGYLRQSDIIQQVLWAGYRIWEPFSIFRSINLNFNQWTGWDFAGTNFYKGGNVSGSAQFKNYWNFGTGFSRSGNGVSRSELRGGPGLMTNGNWNNWLYVSTDDRKKLVFEFTGMNIWSDESIYRHCNVGLNVKWRPLVSLSLSMGPSYQRVHNVMQYVETADNNGKDEYIVGRIDQEMVMANIRVNFSITPDLSLQFWGQPFIFAGDYSEFKKVTHPRTDQFYDQFHQYTGNQISYDGDKDLYRIDENMDGSEDYSFDNPDFKVYEFRSNLVLRWEYIPGSTLYVVWSQGRSDDSPEGFFRLRDDMPDIFRIFPHDVFLVKLTYRLSV